MARFVVAALDGSRLTTRQQWFDGERWIDCPIAFDLPPGSAQTNELRRLFLRIVIEEAGE
jgi:hypothetical protein